MKLGVSLRWRWSGQGQSTELEPLLLTLLAAIGRGASLRAAAAEAGVSYRHAWGLLGIWETRFGVPLVTMARGKGSRLTPLGEALLDGESVIRERLSARLEEAAGELEQRLAAVLEAGAKGLRLCASHDLLLGPLRSLLRQQGVSLAVHICGSIEGLRQLKGGECDLAGFHLPEGTLGQGLVRRYRAFLGPEIRLVTLVRRRQGLMTPAGNPRKIHGIADLTRPGVRFINRQPGSGTRLVLDVLLRQAGCDPAAVEGYQDEEYTHSAVAALVASGTADAGLGLEAAAHRSALCFVPLFWERYVLAVPRRRLADAPLRALLAVLEGDEFRRQVSGLPGYDAGEIGRLLPPEALTKPGFGADL